MAWTKDKPKEPGYYWYRDADEDPEILLIEGIRHRIDVAYERDQWDVLLYSKINYEGEYPLDELEGDFWSESISRRALHLRLRDTNPPAEQIEDRQHASPKRREGSSFEKWNGFSSLIPALYGEELAIVQLSHDDGPELDQPLGLEIQIRSEPGKVSDIGVVLPIDGVRQLVAGLQAFLVQNRAEI